MSSEPGPDRSATLAVLSEAYPALFSGDACPPLMIGVTEALSLARPQVNIIALCDFMEWWTGRPAYLERIVAGGIRVDLDGKPRGRIEGWQQADARQRLGLPREPKTLPQVGAKLPDHLRAKAIRDGNPPGTDLRGDDLAFVAGLLAMHPEAATKARDMVGVRVIEYCPGQNALAVVRRDGSVEDFSVRKCLANRPTKAEESRPQPRQRLPAQDRAAPAR